MLRKVFSLLCVTVLLCTALPAAAYEDTEVVGTLSDLLSGSDSNLSGTTLGYAAADAVREQSGCTLAAVCGGDLLGNLQGGEVTCGDICSALGQGIEIFVIEITPAQLKALLELTVSSITIGAGDAIDRDVSGRDTFLQPSGFSYRYDASALVGDRVLAITLTDTGETLDLEDDTTTYTLAASATLLTEAFDFEALGLQWTGKTLEEMFVDALKEGQVDITSASRVVVIGCTDNSIIGLFPIGTVIVVAVLIALFNLRRNKTMDRSLYNWNQEQGYERKDYYKN